MHYSWTTIPLQKWQELNLFQALTLSEKIIMEVSTVMDIDPDELYDMDVEDVTELHSSLKFLSEKPYDKRNEYIKLKPLTLYPIPFNELTLGQFIDLEYIVKEGYIENFHKLVATIYRERDKSTKLHIPRWEDYRYIDIDKRAVEIQEKVMITDVWWLFDSYAKFREDFLKLNGMIDTDEKDEYDDPERMTD